MAKQTARKARKKRASLLMRIVRGNARVGNPLPGESRVYMDDNYHLSDEYRQYGQRLRDEVQDTLKTHWGEAHLKPRSPKTPTPRWF